MLFTLFIAFESCSQKYLLLDKLGSTKQFKYYEGETLRFKLKGDDHFSTGVIQLLQDSTIILDNGVVYLQDISALQVIPDNKGLLGSSGTRKFKRGGIVLILIDQFNSIVIDGEPARISPGVMIAAGSLVAFGYILDLVRKEKIKIKGNRRLRIMDSIL